MTKTLLTEDDVRALLKAECEKAGGQVPWAREHGVSQGYVAQVLGKRRTLGKSITAPLRLQRVVSYRKMLDDGTNTP